MDDEAPLREPLRIEDYAIIGDCLTGALVGLNGAIDWLCWPRFDSPACFSALLGDVRHGSWIITTATPPMQVRRSYHGNTLVLETIFEGAEGQIAVIDFMPVGEQQGFLVRRVQGRRGRTKVDMRLTLRFGYGKSTPWVTKLAEGGITALAGENLVVLWTTVPLAVDGDSTIANFTLDTGEVAVFTLGWAASHLPPPPAIDTDAALTATRGFWEAWSARCTYQGAWRSLVLRSLLTLKAMTYAPTGAVIAALTTSLPEQLGGGRNWDYRFCWLRDATLTLTAMLNCGFTDEALAWRQWLHRAVAGRPSETQIMYGLYGERQLTEWSPGWLPGYQGASPVRIGNAASEQLQLDIYGEVMDAMHVALRGGLSGPLESWDLRVKFVEYLETIWDQPDDGIWEVRGGRRHFTHTKVMAWVALDRSIRDAETHRLAATIGEMG